MNQVALGFIPEPMLVQFEKILPSRKLPGNIDVSRKYKQVLESIRSIGLIEPLTLCSATTDSGMHILLDGHTRLHAMLYPLSLNVIKRRTPRSTHTTTGLIDYQLSKNI